MSGFVLTCFTGESYDRCDHLPEAVESMQLAENLTQFDNYQVHAISGCRTYLRGVRFENRIKWSEQFYDTLLHKNDVPIAQLLIDEGVFLQ